METKQQYRARYKTTPLSIIGYITAIALITATLLYGSCEDNNLDEGRLENKVSEVLK